MRYGVLFVLAVLALESVGCAGLSKGFSDGVSSGMGGAPTVNPFTDTWNWFGYALATAVGAGSVATIRGYVRGKLEDKGVAGPES